MSGYRPVTDCMIMGRPKYKYHGHFPAGFLERARYLLGCTCPDEGIWHVCSGAVKFYNKSDGFIKLSGYNKKYDVCLDIDANTKPDIIYDVREMDKIKRNGNNRLRIPQRAIKWEHKGNWQNGFHASESFDRPKAMLIDRPYDEPSCIILSPCTNTTGKQFFVVLSRRRPFIVKRSDKTTWFYKF